MLWSIVNDDVPDQWASAYKYRDDNKISWYEGIHIQMYKLETVFYEEIRVSKY